MNSVVLMFAVALCPGLIRSQLLSFPINTIANTGQRVEFECSTNVSLPLILDFAEVNSSRFEFIYFNEAIISKFSSRYKVNTSMKGRWTLLIDSVDVAHAGTYRCQNTQNYDQQERTTNASAQLVVIDSDPVCAANTTEAHVNGNRQTHLRIWCSISYTGNGFPVFNWTKSNAEKNIAATTTTSGQGPVTNTSLIMQPLHANDSGVTFQCQITFRIPNISERVYVHTWNYTLPYFTESYDKSTTVGGESDDKSTTLSTAGVALILASLSLAGFVFLSLGLGLRKLSSFFNAGGAFRRRSGSQARAATIQTDLSTPKDPQIKATSAEYCSITERPSTSQQPELYCELRLIDQPSYDYVNQLSA